MVRGRLCCPTIPEQPVEPALPQLIVGVGGAVAHRCERVGELPEGDLLLGLVPRDRVGLAGGLGAERLRRSHEPQALVVEQGGRVEDGRAELLALVVTACPDKPAKPAGDGDPDIVEVQGTGAPKRELVKDTGDLDAIKKRGTLRVLIYGDGEVMLPRAGASTATDRELAAAFAESLGLKVDTIHVDAFNDLTPALLDGTGDLIAARLTETDERKQTVAFSRPTAVVKELLVHKSDDAAAPKDVASLAGKTIHVRKSSSYRETLDKLAAPTKKDEVAVTGINVVDAPEDAETEQLVQQVAAGKIPYTMCDSDLFEHIGGALRIGEHDLEKQFIAQHARLMFGRCAAPFCQRFAPRIGDAIDLFVWFVVLLNRLVIDQPCIAQTIQGGVNLAVIEIPEITQFFIEGAAVEHAGKAV